ncbi:MAG: ABC transporter ATP-binding protein [Treponema sp.]|nr:ABC transporter ATP-binding protein [Treponema sp.]
MPKITIEKLNVIYKTKKSGSINVFENLNVEFESGKINSILGQSGCGKTTLLNSIAGIIDFDGKIFFDNCDSTNIALKDRNISLVSQKYVLYPAFSVFENIAFPLKMIGASKEEIIKRVKDIAKELELDLFLNRKPKELSGGQQQRVAIARALVKNPSILLLDEPLSNVDDKQRVELRTLIKSLIKKIGCTAIYVTHDFYEAMSISDKIYIINDKNIVFSGSPSEVYNSKNDYVKSLISESFDESIFYNKFN